MKTTLLLLTAAVEKLAASDGAKAAFGGVALSGNIIPNRLFDGSAVEVDISQLQLPAEGQKAFMLEEHDPSVKVGTALAKIKGKQILLSDGQFFSTPKGQELETQFNEGGPFQFSVGFSGETTYHEPKGRKKKTFMGKSHEIGATYVASELLEISFTMAGADRRTSIQRLSKAHGNIHSIEDKTFSKGEYTMTVEELQAQLDAKNAELAQANEKLSLAATAKPDAESEARIQKLQKTIEDMQAAAAQEKEQIRLSQINAVFGDKVSKEEREVYSSMTDAQFALTAKQVKKAAPTFTEQQNLAMVLAGGETEDDGKPKLSLAQQSAMRLGLVFKAV